MVQDKEKESFKLIVPLDASKVKDFEPEHDVKVTVTGKSDLRRENVVKLDKNGKGTSVIIFDTHPGALRMIIGPGTADEEELSNLPAIATHISSKSWQGERELTIPAVIISTYYWRLWFRRCRKYTIHGRVVCEDGLPVPGAKVCVYDVDYFPGPYASQLLGCDYTDVHGEFEMRFHFCCNRWSKKWLQDRVWRYDPDLRQLIEAILNREPDPHILAHTSSHPDLSLFRELLEGEDVPFDKPLYEIDPPVLEGIRKRLIKKMPTAPELETLDIWPWRNPKEWWDCRPDITFKVTQDALEPGTVLVDEGFRDTRWNIPTDLDVTLVIDKANDPLCYDPCPNPPGIDGECLVFSSVCGRAVSDIGGNQDNPGTPEGLYLPGNVTPCNSNWDTGWDGDRPFARIASVEKNCGDLLNVDYYEIEMKSRNRWVSPPISALLDFKRRWMCISGPCPTGDVPFKWVTKYDTGGLTHLVVETREHYEDEGLYHDWWPNGDRIWIVNKFLLAPIDGTFLNNGTYQFRVVGWEINTSDQLTNYRVLPNCLDGKQKTLVLAFHTRDFDQSIHVPNNCGTVLFPTLEPYTHIDRILVNDIELNLGDTIDTRDGDLTIEFKATDWGGYLGYYRLSVIPTVGQDYSLLNRPNSKLTPLIAGTPTGWRANDPDRWLGMYGTALCQGAVAPYWHGGEYRLTVPLAEAFPNPGSHILRLWAWNRTILGSQNGIRFRGEHNHYNNSEYIIWVSV